MIDAVKGGYGPFDHVAQILSGGHLIDNVVYCIGLGGRCCGTASQIIYDFGGDAGVVIGGGSSPTGVCRRNGRKRLGKIGNNAGLGRAGSHFVDNV